MREREFECFGERTERRKTFSVSIKREVTKIDKDENESVVTISHKIKFIDSANLWQVHDQILLAFSQKEFIKLNVKIVIAFLNMKVSRTKILIYLI